MATLHDVTRFNTRSLRLIVRRFIQQVGNRVPVKRVNLFDVAPCRLLLHRDLHRHAGPSAVPGTTTR
jgi:hypothetical protein